MKFPEKKYCTRLGDKHKINKNYDCTECDCCYNYNRAIDDCKELFKTISYYNTTVDWVKVHLILQDTHYHIVNAVLINALNQRRDEWLTSREVSVESICSLIDKSELKGTYEVTQKLGEDIYKLIGDKE